MIKRENYLTKLRQLKDQDLIKVITGIRRCGKSTLLMQFRDELIASGIKRPQIISLNFEDEKNESLLDRHVLSQYLKKQMVTDQTYYIFLDEVQNVKEFEKAVDSLFVQKNTDVYITGSNAFLLSGELATLLSGRYLEINMLPFSFREFIQTEKPIEKDGLRDLSLSLDNFLHSSSFPQATILNQNAPDQVSNYIRDIYQTVLTKDILKRKSIKYPKTFDQVTKFTLDNVGNLMSSGSIAKTISSNDRSIDGRTIGDYLVALADSYIFYPVSRFDIKGKQHLQTLEKYYVVDLGLRQALIGKEKASDLGHLLENIVYLELKRRGGNVYLGKIGDREVDFVVQDYKGNISYYQVAYTIKGDETLARELSPLQKINDNYPKYLLTTDPLSFDENGIKHLNVARWLLGIE